MFLVLGLFLPALGSSRILLVKEQWRKGLLRDYRSYSAPLRFEEFKIAVTQNTTDLFRETTLPLFFICGKGIRLSMGANCVF
jgi:hypothetical protein